MAGMAMFGSVLNGALNPICVNMAEHVVSRGRWSKNIKSGISVI